MQDVRSPPGSLSSLIFKGFSALAPRTSRNEGPEEPRDYEAPMAILAVHSCLGTPLLPAYYQIASVELCG